MSQVWVENDEAASGDNVKDGLINLENKGDTLQSNWSGATAPSSSVTVVGQTWYDTANEKLYLLTTKSPSDTWKQIPVEGQITFDSTWLAADAVVTAAIADDAITAALIADDAVGSAAIADDAILAAHIADDAVVSAAIADDAILAAHIADDAVVSAAIADGAVLTAHFATGAVTSAALGTGAVVEAKLGAAAVTETKVKDNQITVAKMKHTGSTPFVFGKRSTDSVPAEIPISSVSYGGGRLVSQLPTRCTLGNGCFGVLTQDNEIWTIGYTTYASPKLQSTRAYNTSWAPLLFNGTPGTLSKFYLGGTAGYALDENGDVWSWGYNNKGQLGHGDTTARTRAEKIAALDSVTVTDVIVPKSRHNTSEDSVFFLTDAGDLWACGSNNVGQLGLGDTTDRSTPVKITAVSSVASLAFSDSGTYAHCVALTTAGAVYTWGENGTGQLGQGDTTDRSTPTVVSGLTAIDLVSAHAMGGGSSGFSFATDGAVVKSTGSNTSGALGVGDTTQRTSFSTATVAGSPGDIVAVEGSGDTGFAILRDASGNLFSSGENSDSQLGLGDTTDRNTFVAVTMPSTTASKHQVFHGDGNAGACVFLGADGELYGTGYNETGILCQGHTSDVTGFLKFMRHGTAALTDFCVAESVPTSNVNHGALWALDGNGHLYGCGELHSTGIGRQMPDGSPVDEHLYLVPVTVD